MLSPSTPFHPKQEPEGNGMCEQFPNDILQAADAVLVEVFEHVSCVANSDKIRMDMLRAKPIVARAIQADRKAHGWQPIETAPQDGSMVIVYAAPREGLNGFVSCCRWNDVGGWCVDEIREVTHWQFLPAPPAAITEGEA